jgi:DNA invertase Pin-like site-specific DNA recombinase
MSDLFYRAIKAQDNARRLIKPMPKQGQNRQFHRALTEQQIEEVLSLWADGVRKVAIASMTSLAPNSVYNIINRYKLVDGEVTHRKRGIE